MMDELMSAMPNAERYLLELELENFAQGRGMNLSESVSSSKPKAKGKGVDLSMSWEHIAPPATNGVNGASSASATLPIPQRSNAPRFGGVHPANAVRLTRQHAVSVIMPKPPSGPLLFAGIPAGNIPSSAGLFGNAAASTSAGRGGSLFDVAGSANSAPNAFYQPPASTGQKRSMFGMLSASTSARPQPTSAFASVSAQTSAQHKTSGGAADSSIHGPHDADVSMLSELSEPESGADASLSRAEPGAEEEEEVSHAGFAASVFGNVPSAHTRPIATSTGSRIARTETEARMPPGAFLPDDDEHDGADQEAQEEEQERREQASASAARARGGRSTRASASASTSTRTRARAPRSPSPEQQSSYAPALSTRTRRAVKDADLGRSIPGSLMGTDDDDDDNDENDDHRRRDHERDEEEEEEEDVIAPLPAPTPARRTSRKSRASNGSQVEAPRVTRRSSRLSAVSSVGSSSPEPASPQKLSAKSRSSRGGRTSTAGASTSAAKSTATKGSSRKKRT